MKRTDGEGQLESDRTASGIPGAVSLGAKPLEALAGRISACRACPRLVQWREKVGREKRRAFREDDYWARPVPGFGDPLARLLVLGLAPAAHGANRTGRIFTGDRSGEWLFAALHRAGFANRPRSERPGDGLLLSDVFITAAVKCAPPDNRPLPEERDSCQPFLVDELDALTEARVILCLGGFAWEQSLRLLAYRGHDIPKPKPRFGHAAQASIDDYELLGCYHPSQQNTFTGRLTVEMLDGVLARARDLVSELRPVDQPTDAGGR